MAVGGERTVALKKPENWIAERLPKITLAQPHLFRYKICRT